MSKFSNLLNLLKSGIHHWKEHNATATFQEAHNKYLRSQYRNSFSNRIIDRDSLLDIASSTGDVWFGEQEPQFTIKYPPEQQEHGEIEGLTGQYQPGKRYLCEVPGCHIAGPSAVGIYNEGNIILDTVSGNVKKFEQRFSDFFPVDLCQEISFSELNKQASQSISGPVLPLVPYQNQYYYHWLLEQLPKLRLLGQYTSDTGKKPTLLIPEGPPSFVTESLELLGYSTDQLVRWCGGIATVDTLLVTNHRSYSPHSPFYTPSQTDCKWVKDQLVNQIERSNNSSQSRRTYVSRQEASRGRSVVNFDEVNLWLREQDFSVDVFERYPFPKQVRLANRSEVIMGPVGAGLTNILFGDNPLVVELTLTGWTQPFYLLAEILGHRFVSCACATDENNNLCVNTDTLESRLSGTEL